MVWLARWAALGALFGATACQTTSATGPSVAREDAKAPVEKVSLDAKPKSVSDLDFDLDFVYFDYDRWTLREDARRTLKENARKIQSFSGGGMLVVEGHCDERGSEEYNLALGDRRAAAVARYLEDLGVSGSRLRTVSFGESKPAAAGHDESAWRVNRRSEIRIDSRTASR
jgi:peptidoglycan-associated lipoprotein